MRILIIGAGDVGFELGRRLTRNGHDVTMVEFDSHKSRRVSEQLDVMVVEGNGASWQTLRDAGAERVDILAAVTDQDEVNVIACGLGKKLGVKATIARVRNTEYTRADFILSGQALGVDHFIHPEKEAADAVVRLIREASANYAVEFDGGKIQLLGMRVEPGSPMLYRPLSEVGIEWRNRPFRIVAINRSHETLIPRGTDRLVPGDQVFVVCDPDYACEFKTLAGKKAEKQLSNIMVLGGGMVGEFIARELEQEAHVKLVEPQMDRCERLAERLAHSLVIHGDGTDLELLESEDLAEMDAFVAVMGDDERNIIATLLARHANVPRTITMVNRVSYLPIMPKIGLDAVVSKQLLTVNAVQHFIQHQDVAAVASLPGIEAQLIEYIAKAGCRMTRKTLRNIRFPRNAIVGAILHNDHMIVPDGDTQIEQGDRTVVFALPQAVAELDTLFGR